MPGEARTWPSIEAPAGTRFFASRRVRPAWRAIYLSEAAPTCSRIPTNGHDAPGVRTACSLGPAQRKSEVPGRAERCAARPATDPDCSAAQRARQVAAAVVGNRVNARPGPGTHENRASAEGGRTRRRDKVRAAPHRTRENCRARPAGVVVRFARWNPSCCDLAASRRPAHPLFRPPPRTALARALAAAARPSPQTRESPKGRFVQSGFMAVPPDSTQTTVSLARIRARRTAERPEGDPRRWPGYDRDDRSFRASTDSRGRSCTRIARLRSDSCQARTPEPGDSTTRRTFFRGGARAPAAGANTGDGDGRRVGVVSPTCGSRVLVRRDDDSAVCGLGRERHQHVGERHGERELVSGTVVGAGVTRRCFTVRAVATRSA
jgi:hypothetical protein